MLQRCRSGRGAKGAAGRVIAPVPQTVTLRRVDTCGRPGLMPGGISGSSRAHWPFAGSPRTTARRAAPAARGYGPATVRTQPRPTARRRSSANPAAPTPAAAITPPPMRLFRSPPPSPSPNSAPHGDGTLGHHAGLARAGTTALTGAFEGAALGQRGEVLGAVSGASALGLGLELGRSAVGVEDLGVNARRRRELGVCAVESAQPLDRVTGSVFEGHRRALRAHGHPRAGAGTDVVHRGHGAVVGSGGRRGSDGRSEGRTRQRGRDDGGAQHGAADGGGVGRHERLQAEEWAGRVAMPPPLSCGAAEAWRFC